MKSLYTLESFTQTKDPSKQCAIAVYQYFFEQIKPIRDIINDEKGKKLPRYNEVFSTFQNANLFKELYDKINKCLDITKNISAVGNNTQYNYLEVIKFIRNFFSLNENEHINENLYPNWADKKIENYYKLKDNVNDIDKSMFLPYHLFRKLYVDLLLLIATIVSVYIFMDENKLSKLTLQIIYNKSKTVIIELNKLEQSNELNDNVIIEITFSAVGSVNLDSDYDISIEYKIIGNYIYNSINIASLIYLHYSLYIQNIFTYNDDDTRRITDEVFDTNLYTISYLIPDNEIIQYYSNYLITLNDNDNEKISNISIYDIFLLNLNYILVKLKEIGNNEFIIIKENEQLTTLYNNLCDTEKKNCKTDKAIQINNHIKSSRKRSSIASKISSNITSRRESTNTSRRESTNTSRRESNNQDIGKQEILEYCNSTLQESFYSFESYYSSATIIHVVGILQSKQIKLNQLTSDYIKCMGFLSIIENFADLLKFYIEYKTKRKDDNAIYYKISKYIARIYHAFYLFLNPNSDNNNITSYGGYNVIMQLKSFVPGITLQETFKFKDEDYGILNKLLDKIDIVNNKATVKDYSTENFIRDLLSCIMKLSINIREQESKQIEVSTYIKLKESDA